MGKSLKGIIKRNKRISVNGSLWIESNGTRFFGPGPLELLERIHDTGSINQAAKEMKMSYKKAWVIINTLNQQFIRPLVATQSGGARGGGSVVSDEAKELIATYRLLRQQFQNFLQQQTVKL